MVCKVVVFVLEFAHIEELFELYSADSLRDLIFEKEFVDSFLCFNISA